MPYKDPEARKAYQKKYEAENDEYIKRVQREYYQTNKEKRNAYARARYAAMKEAIGDTKIIVTLPCPSPDP